MDSLEGIVLQWGCRGTRSETRKHVMDGTVFSG